MAPDQEMWARTAARRVAWAMALYAILGGVVSLAGWALDTPVLSNWGAAIAIQPNSALAVIAAGCSLFSLLCGAPLLTRAWAGAVLVIGSSAFFENVTGIDLGVDRHLLFGRSWGSLATESPGRMGMPASASFTILGIALLAASLSTARARRLGAALACGAVAIGFLAIVGYAFGADLLYTLPRFSAIALQTATLITALGIGLTAALPDRQPVRTLLETGTAGLLARRAFPLVVFVPLAVGWLRIRGQQAGLFDSSFGTALRTLVEVALFTGLVAWVTEIIRRHERARDREQARAEQANASLAAIVATSDDAIVSKTLDGIITSWNKSAERLFGYSASEVVGRSIEIIIPPELRHEERLIQQKLRSGEPIAHFETVRVAKDGTKLNISLSVSPIRDSSGKIIGGSKVARDITARILIENELRRHRDHLEQLVEERTAELHDSHQKLRLAERMASLGTLSAGLGHDVGNLLVPVRIRLESLAASDLSAQAREDVECIQTSMGYLQKLATSLRMLSLDPKQTGLDDATELHAWWAEVEALMRSILPPEVNLASVLPEGECLVAIHAPALTQIIFNLIQNAGDAMRERGTGHVRVVAAPDGDQVRISVSDDGPGMSAETKSRCMEPFFTTKKRAMSTGLGLVLVYGLVSEAGGTVELCSEPGRGTTFELRLRRAGPATHARGSFAVVALRDARMQSFVCGELRSMRCTIVENGESSKAHLFVTDDPAHFSCMAPSARGIFFGPEDSARGTIRSLGKTPSIRTIRAALRESIALWVDENPGRSTPR